MATAPQTAHGPTPMQSPRDEVTSRLPLPLASLYHEAANARVENRAHDLFMGSYYLWEASVKLLSVAAIAEYARGPKDPDVAKRLKSLERPLLSDWLSYLDLLQRAKTGTHRSIGWTAELLFGQERADLKSTVSLNAALIELLARPGWPHRFPAVPRSGGVQVGEFFGRMSTFRNKELGHGGAGLLSHEFLYEFGAALLDTMTELLPNLKVLTHSRLVYLREVKSHGGGRLEIGATDLTGLIPHVLPSVTVSVSDLAHVPATDRVYLEWHPGVEPPKLGVTPRQPVPADLCPLHPLVLFHPRNKEAWLLNTDAKKPTAGYLCYGVRGDPPADNLKARRDFLAVVTGCDVTAEVADQWAQESRNAEHALRSAAVPLRPEVAQARDLIHAPLATAFPSAPALTAEALHAAYTATAPDEWKQIEAPESAVAALEVYCDRLAQTALAGGVSSPLLEFANKLLNLLPASHATSLSEAIRKAAEVLGAAVPVPSPLPTDKPAKPARPHSLVIVVERSTVDEGKYLVKAWRGSPIDCGAATYTAEELPPVIARLCRQNLKGLTRREPWVEVFLPRELISMPVEGGEVLIGRIPSTVGAENPLLVRPADRYYNPPVDPDELDGWCEESAAHNKLWEAVKAVTAFQVSGDLPPSHHKPGVVYRVPPATTGKWLYSKLRDHRAVLGSVLDTQPRDDPGVLDPLDVLLQIGFPVIAWGRREDATAGLAQRLHDVPPDEVPDRVRQFRVEALACESADHAGNHVVLLYDDPNRPPWDTPAAAQLVNP